MTTVSETPRLNPLKTPEVFWKLDKEGLAKRWRDRAAKGALVAWSNAPPLLLRFLDVVEIREHVYSHMARQAGKFNMISEVAEAEGFSPLYCGYFNIFLGLALLMKRGQEHLIPEELRVPPPQFVVQPTLCHGRGHYGEALAEIWGVPYFPLDYPFTYDPKNFDRNVDYLEETTKDLIAFVEEKTGRHYSMDALKDLMSKAKDSARRRYEIRETCKNVPSPVDFSELVRCNDAFAVRTPGPEQNEIFDGLEAELKERVRNGVGIVSPEKYRLLLCGHPLIEGPTLRATAEALAKRGAAIVANSYAFTPQGLDVREYMPPIGWNMDRPLFTLMGQFAPALTWMPYDWEWQHWVLDYVDYKLDGAILFTQRTCQAHAYLIPQLARDIEEKLKLPTVIIEIDHVDPRGYSQAEVDAQLNAFLDVLEARSKKT